jgi:diadenosine tetraphosphate (Ap4A) HIT family hydrolase
MNGTNPYFVKELSTGYVVLADHQRYPGYTIFLCKMHVEELHQLPNDFRIKHLEEMSIVAEAAYNAFNADKMNHAMLGNLDRHVHWHLIPRMKGDLPENAPIWSLPKEELFKDCYRPSEDELSKMIMKLNYELNLLI